MLLLNEAVTGSNVEDLLAGLAGPERGMKLEVAGSARFRKSPLVPDDTLLSLLQ
jgi:hypothetical protein